MVHAEGAEQLTVSIIDFEIHHGFDFVSISDGMNASILLTGTNAPSSVTVNATNVTIHFDSFTWDYDLKGFLFHIFRSPQNSKFCFDVLVCLPSYLLWVCVCVGVCVVQIQYCITLFICLFVKQ